MMALSDELVSLGDELSSTVNELRYILGNLSSDCGVCCASSVCDTIPSAEGLNVVTDWREVYKLARTPL